MRFEHDNHEEVYGQLKTYLGELFDEYQEEDDGHFYVRYGSTVLEIAVEPYGPEQTVVMITAYCVQGVEVDEELMTVLLQLNHSMAFGSFSLVGQDIFFRHCLFGGTLERKNMLNALAAVANISDDYDDRIVSKYGGQRALDRIRDTGGRRRREGKDNDGRGAEDSDDLTN